VILSAGLTPVWQQVLLFDALAWGEVNRAREAHWCASGKVLNVARALHHLNAPGKALTVVGGSTGGAVRRDAERLGLAARWVDAVAPTRICTTVVEAGRHTATELVANAGALDDAEIAAFEAAYVEEAAAAAVVVLIGSLPAGTPPDFYRRLLARTPGRAVVDARGPELLEALHERPFLVKPNRSELQQTLGRELTADASLFDAMRELNERGVAWVVVTDGRNPVHVRGQGRLYRLRPPTAEVLNPIGCGDCLAAGIARALHGGAEPVDAVRYGVATAADKLGRLLPGVVVRDGVDAQLAAVEVTPL
jgi:1-phosphofructokinase family hexose kinase